MKKVTQDVQCLEGPIMFNNNFYGRFVNLKAMWGRLLLFAACYYAAMHHHHHHALPLSVRHYYLFYPLHLKNTEISVCG